MEDELFEDMIFYIENPSEGGDKYSKLKNITVEQLQSISPNI